MGCWSARLAQLGGLRRSAQQAGCRWSLSRVGRLSRVGGLSLVGGRLSVGGLLISGLQVGAAFCGQLPLQSPRFITKRRELVI